MENYLILVLIALFGCLGLFAAALGFRARALKRLRFAMESYADREIAQQRGRKVRKKSRMLARQGT